MALTSAEILPTKCLTTYRGVNTQYKGLPIERLTCYHTKLLCTGSPLTAASQQHTSPIRRCRGSGPAQKHRVYDLFEKLRSRTSGCCDLPCTSRALESDPRALLSELFFCTDLKKALDVRGLSARWSLLMQSLRCLHQRRLLNFTPNS